MEILGTTLDDAAGECFDKVGRVLGMPYPGGAALDKAASRGDETKYTLPRSKPGQNPYDMSFSGLKESSILVFSIVKEAALRMTWQNLCAADSPIISNWDAMIDYCRMKMAHKTREEFMLIFLDAKLKVIGQDVQQRGTTDNVAIHPAEVVKSAIFNNAKSVIMVHNHPTGVVTPSKADILVTKQIFTALQSVDIKLQDHIIVGKDECYSFRDAGLF
jgi:DNA repair protein RadC